MNILIPLVILLIIGIIYIYSVNASKSRLLGILTIIALIIFYFLLDMRASFVNTVPAPLDYKMGNYSNIDLSKSKANKFRWNYEDLKLTETDTLDPTCPYGKVPNTLISDVTIFSPVGDGIKLTEDLNAGTFPSVDGKRGSPRSMFMLAHNQVSADCCPSTFSSDKGCVCLTGAQRNLLQARGGNRQAPDEY